MITLVECVNNQNVARWNAKFWTQWNLWLLYQAEGNKRWMYFQEKKRTKNKRMIAIKWSLDDKMAKPAQIFFRDGKKTNTVKPSWSEKCKFSKGNGSWKRVKCRLGIAFKANKKI